MAQPNLNLDVRPGYKLVHKTDGNREEYYYERHYGFLDGSSSGGFLPTVLFVLLLIVGVIWLSSETDTPSGSNYEQVEQSQYQQENNEDRIYEASMQERK